MCKGLPGTGGVRDPGISSAQRRIQYLLSIWNLVALRMWGHIQDLGTLGTWDSTQWVPVGIRDPGGLLVPCWASSIQHHPGFREQPVPGENPIPNLSLGTQQHLGPLERMWVLVGHLGLGVTWDLGVHPGPGWSSHTQQHPVPTSIQYREHPILGASASCCPPLAAGDTTPPPPNPQKPLGSPLGLG